MDPKISELLTFAGADNATSFSSAKGASWTGEGGAKLSTTSPMYAPASGLISASSNYFKMTDLAAAFQLGAGDFSAEAWFQTTDSHANIVDAQSDAGGFGIFLEAAQEISFYSGGGDYLKVHTAPLAIVLNDGNPKYVNFTRQSGTLGLIVNDKFMFYSTCSSLRNYSYTPTEVNLARSVADPTSWTMDSGKFGGLRITVGGIRFPLADLASVPSPYDDTGGGGIVEGVATITGDWSSSIVSAKLLGGIWAADGVDTIPWESAKLLGADATIDGAETEAYTGTAIAGGDAALPGVGDVAAAGGAIVGTVLTATGDAAVIWNSNQLAAGETEMGLIGDAVVSFLGSSVTGGDAVLDGINGATFEMGATITTEFAIDGQADVVARVNFILSSVATLVADAVIAWQAGIVPGSGGDNVRPAALLRRMRRISTSRHMARPSISRSMKR